MCRPAGSRPASGGSPRPCPDRQLFVRRLDSPNPFTTCLDRLLVSEILAHDSHPGVHRHNPPPIARTPQSHRAGACGDCRHSRRRATGLAARGLRRCQPIPGRGEPAISGGPQPAAGCSRLRDAAAGEPVHRPRRVRRSDHLRRRAGAAAVSRGISGTLRPALGIRDQQEPARRGHAADRGASLFHGVGSGRSATGEQLVEPHHHRRLSAVFRSLRSRPGGLAEPVEAPAALRGLAGSHPREPPDGHAWNSRIPVVRQRPADRAGAGRGVAPRPAGDPRAALAEVHARRVALRGRMGFVPAVPALDGHVGRQRQPR